MLARFHAAAATGDRIEHFVSPESIAVNVSENFVQARAALSQVVTEREACQVEAQQIGFIEETPLCSTVARAPGGSEQIDVREQVDERTDIWSLGVVLFEALTGSLPFVETWFGRRQLNVQALERQPALPEGLATIIRRCLALDRSARFPSAVALSRALAPFDVLGRAPAAALGLHRLPLRAQGRYRRDSIALRVGDFGGARVCTLHHARGKPVQPCAAHADFLHRA